MRLSKVFLIPTAHFPEGTLCEGLSLIPRQMGREKKIQKCDCLQIRCKSSVKYCSKLIARHKDYKYIQQFLQGKVKAAFPLAENRSYPTYEFHLH